MFLYYCQTQPYNSNVTIQIATTQTSETIEQLGEVNKSLTAATPIIAQYANSKTTEQLKLNGVDCPSAKIAWSAGVGSNSLTLSITAFDCDTPKIARLLVEYMQQEVDSGRALNTSSGLVKLSQLNNPGDLNILSRSPFDRGAITNYIISSAITSLLIMLAIALFLGQLRRERSRKLNGGSDEVE
jgi:hypothetical protein